MAKKKKKSKIIIPIILVVLVLVIIVLKVVAGSGDAITMVDTEKAVTGDITSTLDTSGTIASDSSKVYSSAVTASVAEVNVAVGDTVSAGDYLLTYDTSSLEDSYTLADLQAKAEAATANDSLSKSSQAENDKANAEADKANLEAQVSAKEAEIAAVNQSITDYQVQTTNNTKELTDLQTTVETLSAKKQTGELSEEENTNLTNAQNRINEINAANTDIANSSTLAQADLQNKNSELTDLQTQLSAAEAIISASEATILSENAKENLNYTTQASQITVTEAENNLSVAKAGVTADFDGIVTSVDIVSGAAAAEGQALVTVADASAMKVDFQISKYNLEDVAVGQVVTITSLDQEYSGTVTSISKVATASESGSTMVSATVSIDNPDSSLVIGLDAKLAITLAQEKNVVLVPAAAVNTETDGDFVYTLKDGVITKQMVTIGISSKDQTQILSGVEDGDEIITTIDSSIVEGAAAIASGSTGLETEESEADTDNTDTDHTEAVDENADTENNTEDETESQDGTEDSNSTDSNSSDTDATDAGTN